MSQGMRGAEQSTVRRSVGSQMELWYEQGFLTYAMLIVGAFCLIFAIYDYFKGDLFYASALFACSAAVFIGLTVLVLTGVNAFLQWYFGLLLIALFFFLVLNGGVAGTGLYWCLGFSPGIVSILGYANARYVMPLIIGVLAVVFGFDLYPWQNRMFAPEVELRFLGALSGLSLFTIGQDYAFRRARGQLVEQQLPAGSNRVGSSADLISRTEAEQRLQFYAQKLDGGGQDCVALLVVIGDLFDRDDHLGREFGDEMLGQVTAALQQVLRSGDAITRWNDDQFLILLEGQNKKSGHLAQQRIRKLLSSLYLEHGGKQVLVTFEVRMASVACSGSVSGLIAALSGAADLPGMAPVQENGLRLH